MKKDIEIPEVENVVLAITEEPNDIFKTKDHYVYLINKKDHQLEMVLIVSSGSDKTRETSKMRHKIEVLPPQSFAKVELMQEDILALDNHFKVSFFENNRLMEKEFILKKNSFKEGALRHIKLLDKRGITLK
jgi:hypothetical protein